MLRPLIWVACPTAATLLDAFPIAPVVYQLSDCYAAIGGGASKRIEGLQDVIAARADLVLCASDKLLELAIGKYGQGEYVDHGVDFDLFAQAHHAPAPDELGSQRRPIVGFFGNMDGNTVDRELLDAVIASRPAMTFALVGPMASEFRSLTRHDNVVAIPRRPYAEIARYDWIAHCNPVKLKEYLALGKPIVTTPFAELHRYPGLYYEAADAASFASAIDRALEEDSPESRRERRAAAAQHTWDVRFQTVLELLARRNIYVDGDASTHTRRDGDRALAVAR